MGLSRIRVTRERLFSKVWMKKGRIVLFCSFFALGSIGSYLVWLNGRMIPGLSINGIKVGGVKTEEVRRLVNVQYWPSLQKKVTLTYQNRTFDVVLGAIGIQPDIAASVRKAYLIGRTGAWFSRLSAVIQTRQYGHDQGLVFRHNQPILESFYRLLEASIGREPVRAVVRVGKDGHVRYTPSRSGRLIERQKLTHLFEKAVSDIRITRIEIPVKTVTPTLTSADIIRWRLDRVVGMYITPYNATAIERAHNIKTACEALDNVIIYPGQNFSFNTWIGPRMANTGYKEAPVLYQGKIVSGIGGGVCQVSTTLYNAVLLANLQIVKRFNHSLPSAYVPLGRDATVVNGGLDLIFTNTLTSPILLTAELDATDVRVAVLGEKGDWQKITLQTELVETYPYEMREVSDSNLIWGEKKIVSEGSEGAKVKLWRTVELPDGSVKRDLVNTSIYPAIAEECAVGTKSP